MKSLNDFQASAIKSEAMTQVQGGTGYDIVIVWAAQSSCVIIENITG